MKGTRQGDFSRFPLERRKRYSAVHMQQGRVHLDADWNEQADLFDHRLRTATADLLGPDGAPAETAGFGLAAEHRCLELGLDQQYVLIGGREGWPLPEDGSSGSGLTVEVRLLARTEGQVFGCWVQRDGEGRPRPACTLHLRDGALVFHRAGIAGDLAAEHQHLHGRLLRVAVSWSDGGSAIYLDGERLAGDRGFALPPGRVFFQVGGRQAPLLEGLFYDFRLWGQLRSPEELASYGDRDLGGDEPGLLGYWRFDGDGASVPNRAPSAWPSVTEAVVRGSSSPTRWLPADLRIGPGRYYVDGVLCESLETAAFTSQHETPGAPMPQPAGRDPEHHVFYLDVWERSVSAVEDPDLREIALGGADTATRSRVMAQVKSLPLPPGPDRLTAREVYELWPSLIAPELVRGRMAAARQRPATPRLENRLYRVEVHDGGDGGEAEAVLQESVSGGLALTLAVWDGGWRTGQVVEVFGPDAGTPEKPGAVGRVTGADPGAQSLKVALAGSVRPAEPLRVRRIATLKWSRDNASAVYPISRLDAGSGEVTLGASPVGAQGLEKGRWVEVMDAAIASGPACEPLWQVTDVRSVEKENKVRLAGPVTGAAAKPGEPAFLRLWDQTGGGLTSWGVLPAIPGRWLDLEAGIQVCFEYDGPYRTGDYWGLPARGLSQDVQWPHNAKGRPLPLPPHGAEHRHCPLALLTYEPEGYRLLDLRRTFQPYVTGAVSKAGDWMDGPLEVRAPLAVRESLEVDGTGRFAAVYGPLCSPDAVGTPQLRDASVTPSKLASGVGVVPNGYSILGPEAEPPRGYSATGWSFSLFSDEPRWTDRYQVPGGSPGPLQSVAVGGKVYTLLESGILWELDPAANRWRPRCGFPSPGRDFGMASLQGKVYVAGGLDAAGRSMPQLFEYDPAADSWTRRAAPRTPRSSFALVACGDWLHALGGLRDSLEGKCTTARHEAWDPVTDTWHSRRPLPRRVHGLAAAVLGDRISVVGGEARAIRGRWGHILTGEHHQYDPAADRWLAPRAPLPSPRRSPRLVEVYGRLYAVGGEGALGWLADFAAYDPASDSWRSLPPLHEPLEAPGAAAVAGSVYVTGAVRPGGVLIEECPVALKLFVHRRQPPADAEDGGEPRWS